MQSFDVKGLSTKVFLDEIIETSVEHSYLINTPSLRKESFIHFKKISKMKYDFSCNNIMFCQSDGVALLLDPTLANILMGYIKHKIIPKK